MSTEKNKNLRKTILRRERERDRILSEMLSVRRMLRGSYALVHTKCGRSNCWCADGEGHPHSRITWSEDGQQFTRKVPPEEIAWVQAMTAAYRRFRALRRSLIRLQAESKDLLDKMERDVIERTRKGKVYLHTAAHDREQSTPPLPKTKRRRKNARRTTS